MQAPAARRHGPVQADVLLAVALGGAVGALLRLALGRRTGPPGQGWPWATFAENLSGSLLLGALLVVVVEQGRGHRLARPFLGVGVLGTFTTMSAYGLETQQLLLADRPALAAAYAGCTLAGAMIAVLLGVRAARGLLPQGER